MFEYATQEIPYSAISTYRIYNSPYYYIVGNPNLNIPTQWSLTGMLTLFNKLSLTIGTTHLKDDVEYITKTDSQEPNISFDQAINADRIRTYLMALEVMIKPTKWWIAKPHMDLMITSGKWVEYVNKLFTKEEETANKYLKISQSYLYSSKLSQNFFLSHSILIRT